MSKKILATWSYWDEAAAAQRGIPAGVCVRPLSDGRVVVSVEVIAERAAPFVEGADQERQSDPSAAQLEAALAKLPELQPAQAADERLQAGQRLLADLEQKLTTARSRSADPNLCSDPAGLEKLLALDHEISALARLVERQRGAVDGLGQQAEAAWKPYHAAAAALRQQHDEQHEAARRARRDKATMRLVEGLVPLIEELCRADVHVAPLAWAKAGEAPPPGPPLPSCPPSQRKGPTRVH
ncbi:MAG TPA: hypothetical protein VF897_04260 [Roseiflexaceae bacterium]